MSLSSPTASMSQSDRVDPPPRMPAPSLPERVGMALVGCGLLGVLGVAAWLTPNPAHYGTHQQLGLPPCTFAVIAHKPCPTCGMTTAFAHVMHGEPWLAVRANAAGTLLCLAAIVAGPWLIVAAVRGRWCGWQARGTIAAYGAGVVLMVALLQWSLRLWSLAAGN